MRTIHALTDDVISKIAAGEVIERPAYVVKELVENSIDAGADTITVSVEDYGLKQITVTDNGHGMSREDVEVCFLPHSTSKLKLIEDLHFVKSFGFRGEALSSIAQVATLTIQTRRKEDIGGTIVTIRNGVVEEISSTGSSTGTTITVNNLFSSLPARKKFLKSDKTEFRLIGEVYSSYILSHPSIHFVFKHNKKTLFDFPKGTESERMAYFLGSVSQDLIPLRFSDNRIEVSGYIGKPQSASRNSKQHIFVNSRFVRDQIINLSVKEAFGTLLPASFNPVFILSIFVPVEMTDVNIHPRKEKVAFLNQKEIFDVIKHSVSEILAENNLTFRLAKFRNDTSAKVSETRSVSGLDLKNETADLNLQSLGSVKNISALLQVQNTYICAPTKNGLVLIDQHAAHERVFFENLKKTYAKKRTKNITLTTSKTVMLSFADSRILEEYESHFEKLGFSFEHFKSTGIIIRKIPLLFKGRNIEKIIEDMIADLSRDVGVSDIDKRSEKMLMFLACRAAVKAGDPLQQKQMKELVSRLEKTDNNETCPHGRPTKIVFSSSELNKWFKRN